MNSLKFHSKKGEFILHEEYMGLIFSDIEKADKFISKRVLYWEDIFSMELTVSPDQNETIKMNQIEHVFHFVAKEFGIHPKVVFGRERDKTIFEVRRYAFRILLDRGIVPQMIQDVIQRKYSKSLGFDRSSIIHQCTKFDGFLKQEEKTREKYELIKDKILVSLNGRYLEDGSGKKTNKYYVRG